jgi:hypothetical protein
MTHDERCRDQHETILQAIVRQMIKDGSHDISYIRALVTQAANPRWRGEPLKTCKPVAALNRCRALTMNEG